MGWGERVACCRVWCCYVKEPSVIGANCPHLDLQHLLALRGMGGEGYLLKEAFEWGPGVPAAWEPLKLPMAGRHPRTPTLSEFWPWGAPLLMGGDTRTVGSRRKGTYSRHPFRQGCSRQGTTTGGSHHAGLMSRTAGDHAGASPLPQDKLGAGENHATSRNNRFGAHSPCNLKKSKS